MSFRATILGMCALAGSLAAVSAHAERPQAHSVEAVWLEAHNAERAEFGVAPLAWSAALTAQAKDYADVLAQSNRLQHSRYEERRGQGENLWMGTRGYYSPADMIRSFADEKRHFKSGTFPQVSRTGNWGDVGHFTQIVWADTREVGCAVAAGPQYDVLVCRYWPAGNVVGQRIAQRVEIARR